MVIVNPYWKALGRGFEKKKGGGKRDRTKTGLHLLRDPSGGPTEPRLTRVVGLVTPRPLIRLNLPSDRVKEHAGEVYTS